MFRVARAGRFRQYGCGAQRDPVLSPGRDVDRIAEFGRAASRVPMRPTISPASIPKLMSVVGDDVEGQVPNRVSIVREGSAEGATDAADPSPQVGTSVFGVSLIRKSRRSRTRVSRQATPNPSRSRPAAQARHRPPCCSMIGRASPFWLTGAHHSLFPFLVHPAPWQRASATPGPMPRLGEAAAIDDVAAKVELLESACER